MSLEAFFARLNLTVTLAPIECRHLEQVALLTQRTAEFHLSAQARSAGELAARLACDGVTGWTIEVADRFGDYGVAGALIVAASVPDLVVDTFLLNCRVLGKRVEDRIVHQLAEIAQSRGCRQVVLDYRRTPRNGPAGTFVRRIGAHWMEMTEGGWKARVPAEAIAAITAPAPAMQLTRTNGTPAGARLVAARWARRDPHERSALLMTIAADLRSGDQILAAMRRNRRQLRLNLGQGFAAPTSKLECEIAAIWQELLNVEQVGRHDDFFALGGHSLLATQVIARLRRTYQLELPLRSLFEQPTIAGLAEQIERVRSAAPTPEAIPIAPVPRDQALPASFAQRRLWFLDQLQPGNPAYNVPVALRLIGRIDLAALERALNLVVERHEALRTTFTAVDGEPIQVIAPAAAVPLAALDLRALPASECEATARRLAMEEVRRPFDLASLPLVRATILRLDEADQMLVLTLHHSICDGWSMGVLVQELAALYQSLITKAPAALAPLLVQYADVAVWQRKWLQGANDSYGSPLDRQLAYWRAQLGGDLPAIQLPTDRPRPAMPTLRGARYDFMLPGGLSEELQAFSRTKRATLFMTLLAAWATLLYRYTGQSDITIGTPVANRTHAEVERLIGFFANTLVLRVNLEGGRNFGALLGRVREVCLGAYAHQDLPFEQLVEALQPQRDLSHHPLFQVLFVLQNTPLSDLELGGLKVSPLRLDSGTSKFDLTLSLAETQGGLEGSIEYNTDLFDESTIARMAGHLKILLMSIVAAPDRSIDHLPLLPAAELRILEQWNDTTVQYLEHRCLHHLIEAQVERSPEAIAVEFEGRLLTYQELNARANQAAHYLQRHGVESETLVGVCMERSLELVIALLAVLKSGGAYVPLDPTYPPERLAFMLEDSQARVLLTSQELRDWRLEIRDSSQSPISNLQSPIVACLDTDWPLIAQQPMTCPDQRVRPDNLAYVIYTSGSTGKPKGAMNSHAGICNRLLWMQATYQLDQSDRILQKTPFSFDVSVWEFFWPLLAGASLVVAQPGGHQDLAYLVRTIADRRISTLHFVPSMLQLFLEEPGLEQLTYMRRVICSGEALPSETQERFFTHMSAELHNLYGPTEAAVDVTAWACERGSSRHSVPIGRPIANTQIYILDRLMQPVPIGVAGELHIGGVQLARGYLGRPDLAAEKFVPNPFQTLNEKRETINEALVDSNSAFSVQPLSFGGRLYKTGDLARYLPDGSIEFLGRIDHQIKIRGLRIELEEIEHALRQEGRVREALVVTREDARSGKRLVAYVVPNDKRQTMNDEAPIAPTLAFSVQPLALELRAFLKDRLPSFMVPAAYVFLPALPLSPNGKVDRRALPEPPPEAGQPERVATAPRTPLEQRLAGLWRELLDVQSLGIDDNFFDLGGDSFKAIRLVQQLDRSVSVVDVLKYQTIRTLAAALEAEARSNSELLSELTDPARDRRIALVCIPYGGGSALAYQPLASALPPEYALYAVTPPGHDYGRQDQAPQPIEAVAQRCVKEIMWKIRGPLALYGHCVGTALALEIARQLMEAGRQPAAVFLGAALPPAPRQRWRIDFARLFLLNRLVPHKLVHAYLKRLGGFDGLLDWSELRFVMEVFRHDGRLATAYFERQLAEAKSWSKHVPIFCIIGDNDPLTGGYRHRFPDWQRFGEMVKLLEIKGAGHYFVKHQATELARLIANLNVGSDKQ